MELKQERLVDPNLYNPPLAFQELAFANKHFFVVRDDLLPSGTKGRAMVDFMKRSPATDFIYAGPSTGYAQIVVAYAAALCGKRAHVFVEKNEPRNNLTAAAIHFGGNVTEVPKPAWLAKLQSIAAECATELQRRNSANSVHNFPLGFHEEAYIQLLADKIREAAPPSLLTNPPQRLWLTCGSATVLQAVSRVFPTTYYQVVQVGRNIWPDLLDGVRHNVYIAPEHFASVAQTLPPYPSVSTYDAKLWQFVLKYGEEGDFIWNVGCDVPELNTPTTVREKAHLFSNNHCQHTPCQTWAEIAQRGSGENAHAKIRGPGVLMGAVETTLALH